MTIYCILVVSIYSPTFYFTWVKGSSEVLRPQSVRLLSVVNIPHFMTHPLKVLGQYYDHWFACVSAGDPEDTFHRGVLKYTSVDIKYCGWLRSIRIFKSIFRILYYQFYKNCNWELLSIIPLGFWHVDIWNKYLAFY